MDEFENKSQENSEEINEEIVEENAYEPFEEEIDEPKKGVLREILDWLICIVVAVAIALVIRNYVFTLVNVSGHSMDPTLNDKDVLYVNRFMYEPEVGDIIVFKPKNSPDTPYVKRVIALEGQVVEFDYDSGSVIVDGEIIEEDYILEPIDSLHFGNMTYPYTVPQDHIYALGDNRNNSSDSRLTSVGAVSEESIIGKAIFRIIPFGEFGSLYK